MPKLQTIEDVITKVYSTLPSPTADPLDFHTLKGKVNVGHAILRNALKVLVVEKRAETMRTGLRTRKVFRRTEGA